MALSAVLGASPAEARTNRALIVAVSDYPNLPKSAQLKGPKNDAVLVRDYLTTAAPVPFDPANVRLLADIEGSTVPTHAAILSALAELAGQAERGDFIYLQFSGHGSQQPALQAGAEQDGFDEVFLPSDTGMFREKKEGIPNGLGDDEIAGALDAIRAKGAFVWVVFDACHSGTATRAVGAEDADVSERKIDPADLGIPQALLDEAAASVATRDVGAEPERENALGLTDASETSAEATGRGGMVAFFAAQTVETTPEMTLPKGEPGAQKLGLFTHTLFSRLAENPGMTYRQLGQSVLQRYSALNRQKPTPLFEGDLDAQVFGSEVGERVPQWRIAVAGGRVSLKAGLMHRLTPGTKLAILGSPAAALTDAVGYLEVKTAKNLTSTLAPVAHDGKPAPALTDIPAGAFARLAETSVDLQLTVARPPAGGFAPEQAAVARALDAIAANAESGVNMRLVDAGQPADLTLAIMAEREMPRPRSDAGAEPMLWFLPPSGEISLEPGRTPPRIALGSATDAAGLGDAVAENLLLISRATNLSRLAGASDFRPDEVGVEFLIRRAESDALEPIVGGAVPVLRPDDEIHMRAKNVSTRPVDINILYIGSNYRITAAVTPYRLHPKEEFPITGLFAIEEGGYGMERMIAIMTEAEPQSEVEDLSFLAQPAVRAASRDVGVDEGFAGLLRDIGGAPPARDVKPLGAKAGPRGAVLIVPMETAPRL